MDCECGCGEAVTPGKRFRKGHWGRVQPRQVFGPHLWDKRDMGYETPCWVWNGAVRTTGYGQFSRCTFAHRLSYETHVGPIPDGLDIDHLCGVRLCVNPDHLEPVTRAE